MKRLFTSHIYFGRLANRTDDFLDQSNEDMNVRPTMFRWFGGMHDMESTFILQMM